MIFELTLKETGPPPQGACLTMLEAIMVALVVGAFLLAGGYAKLCNNLLAPSDADLSLSS
jgi:hypothetical protein